jgi:hypothetical protein
MGAGASPERPRIGVVVGEGHPVRMGLLRFVLEGEGFLVLAEASSTVELVQALAIHRPEAVVLDDGIGATAVAVTREMCPNAKVVLVWPTRLVPISGDACVDPTDVLRDLGPAIERVCGLDRAEPSTAEVRTLPARRRRRGSSHPSRGPGEVVPGPGVARERVTDEGEAVIVDREPAPVLILPVTPVVEPDPQP